MPGIERAFASIGVLNIASSNCLMLQGLESYSEPSDLEHQRLCKRTTTSAFAILREQSSISTVVMSAQVAAYTDPALRQEFHNVLKSSLDTGDSPVALYASALERNLQQITALGKKMVIILDIPHLGFDPRECVRQRVVDAFRSVREPLRS